MSYGKGSVHSTETKTSKDEETGASILQLTSHDSINHHLYPLTCSTTPDMQWVVFTSNRSGEFQFFKAEFPNGDTLQLTDTPGGVHGYSGHLTRDGSELIYTTQGEVRAVDLGNLSERTLALWEGASLGEGSLCSSGEWLVTAMKWEGKNYLAVVKTDGTEAQLILECERTIIHPQFHPTDENLIEYAQDPAPRIWLIQRDGSNNVCLYQHENDEFIVHETWLGTTGDLITVHWPFALKRLDLSRMANDSPPPTSAMTTITEFNSWHIAPNRAGTKIACDTCDPDIGLQMVDLASGERATICHPRATCGGSQWRTSRYALKEDFERAGKEKGALSWMEVKVDTVYGPQWSHPHPSWSTDEKWCIYDSDISGTTQVYAIELK